VTVTITSKAGYYYDELEVDGTKQQGKPNPYSFPLKDKDVTVKAYFKILPADTYKVILKQPDEGGTISFTIAGANGEEFGSAGSTVTLSNTPANGYIFKEYIAKDDAGQEIPITDSKFTLPAKNITVSGVFEKSADDEDPSKNEDPKKIEDLIDDGKTALEDGDWSAAITAYEKAYTTDSNNTEALVYSTIGKLASIAWSTNVGNFFKNHLGLKDYPNTLDALINPNDWFDSYPDKDNPNYVSLQPPLNIPGWLKDKTPYNDSLVSTGSGKVASSAAWPILLIANLIDKNTTGLNAALDDAIAAIFNNSAYTEATTRTAKLKGKEPVKLDADIVADFGLSGFFGSEDVYIGWAELELLLSALKLVKATLLYVDSYNWNYDIGFVKNLPWDESALDQIDAIVEANRNKVLPLRINFMTDRGGSYLENSRQAYIEAIESIIGVYDYYTGSSSKLPTGYKDTLNDFKWTKDAAVKLKTAIRDRGTFHVQDTIPNGDTYNNTGTNALFSINFAKLFTPGQLALEKLIETEGSGSTKSPVFYGHTDGTPGSLKKIESSGDLDKYDGIALKFKIGPIGDIIGNNFAKDLLRGLGFVEFSGEDPVIVFDPTYAALTWAAYHWDDGGKEIFQKLFDDE
jgi:hypothetical protein